MGILEALWDSNIAADRRQPTQKESALTELIVKKQEQLTHLLSPEARAIFDELTECQEELTALSDCGIFIEGIRMGAKLILEITAEGS